MKKLTTLFFLAAALSAVAFAQNDDAPFTDVPTDSVIELRGAIYTGWDVEKITRAMPAQSTSCAVQGLDDLNGLEDNGKVGPARYRIEAFYAPANLTRNFKGSFKIVGTKNSRLELSYVGDYRDDFDVTPSNIAVGTTLELDCNVLFVKGGSRPCSIGELDNIIAAGYGWTNF